MAEIIPIGDGADRVRAACRAAMDSAGLSIAQASREIGDGVSAATLGRWLRGTYTGDVPAVTARIDAWILTRSEGDALSLAEAGLDRHAETDAATSIDDALAYAHSSKDIVLVHGPSGRGKTRAAERYRETHSRVFYMPATRAMITMVSLLECLGEAIGAYPASVSAISCERAIIDRLRQGSSLVIIDEAHHLRDALLDELRCIRDIAGCGLALIGNDAILMSIRRCPQILGRTGIRLNLSRLAAADVAAIAAAPLGRRPTKGELKPLVSAARGPGGLHTLRRVLAEAWKLARAEEREGIDSDCLMTALVAIVGLENHGGESEVEALGAAKMGAKIEAKAETA